MSWGKDLWDQGENIAVHTKRGIEFLDRYAGFLTERYKIENDYAKQLKLLTAKYTPKKRDEEDCHFSNQRAFYGMLGELGDVANQHERVAEQFRDEVVVEIAQIAKRLREQRKEYLEEALRLQTQLSTSIEAMRKTLKEYNRTYKESEAAKLKYDKAEQDMNLSRAEVAKAKNNSIAKLQQAEEAKNSHALQLQRTNEFQHEYYTRLLPSIFERLREVDETRIAEISRLMTKCVDIERSVLPIVEKCLQGMLDLALQIDAHEDSSVVVQRYKSGYAVPQDYPFDDLSNGGAEGPSSAMITTNGNGIEQLCNGVDQYNQHSENGYGYGGMLMHGQIPTSPMAGGTNRRVPQRKPSTAGSIVSRVQSAKRGKLANLFKSKSSSDETFKDDYSDLPPQQQCKRLANRIEAIRRQMETKMAQKNGLLRMQSVYLESPQLGDVTQVETEQQKCTTELGLLQAELTKYQSYLREASSRLNIPINAVHQGSSPPHGRDRNESMSSSSFSSFDSTPKSTPRAPPPNRPPPPVSARSCSIPQPDRIEPDEEDDEETLGRRSESEYSVGGCQLGVENNNKPKSRTSTSSMNCGGSGHSSSTAGSNRSYGKPPVILSASPESGLGSAAGSSSSGSAALATAEDYDEWVPSDDDRDEIYQNNDAMDKPTNNTAEQPVVILGTCKALYHFAGEGDGMVPMKEGDEMLLLERDAGDGWTKVRKEKTKSDGFVPSSYLECKWYPEE